jgi:hypothetical protein
MQKLLAPLILAVALAACEEQTAKAPNDNAPQSSAPTPSEKTATETISTPTNTATAPTSTATDPTARTAPATGTTGNAGPEQFASGQAPSGGAKPDATQIAAAPPVTLEPYQGRTYIGGPISLRLNPDNSFVMAETAGKRRVEGSYTFEDGVVTFSEAKGDTGPQQFPMRCRLQAAEQSGGFRLTDQVGCNRFGEFTFTPSAS